MSCFAHSDIDECTEDADGCAQICTDTDGSYNCSCGPGYELANDQRGCDGKHNYYKKSEEQYLIMD